MLTYFDMISILLPPAGAIVLGELGARYYGVPGTVVGVLAGAIGGFVVSRNLRKWIFRIALRSFARRSVDELRAELRDEDCLEPNFILTELRIRNMVAENDLWAVLSKLESDSSDRRSRGWVALRSAYPEVIVRIPTYDPTAPVEKCRAMIGALRKDVESSGTPLVAGLTRSAPLG